ncbi:hypothetical protein M0804_000535 [Polistes exclamans]|nr:hypothetical protein M0804_000535 [Polistes exclamans]
MLGLSCVEQQQQQPMKVLVNLAYTIQLLNDYISTNIEITNAKKTKNLSEALGSDLSTKQYNSNGNNLCLMPRKASLSWICHHKCLKGLSAYEQE